MILIYMDESGDDGIKPGASPILSIGCVKVSSTHWSEIELDLILCLEKMANEVNPGFSSELHTRKMLSKKGAFKNRPLTVPELNVFLKTIQTFIFKNEISISTFAIIKDPVKERQPLKCILLKAINENDGQARLIISDRGRVPLMRTISRNARQEGLIKKCFVENILESESKYNHLVQLADLFATAAYLRTAKSIGIQTQGRITTQQVDLMIQILEGANCSYCLVRP